MMYYWDSEKLKLRTLRKRKDFFMMESHTDLFGNKINSSGGKIKILAQFFDNNEFKMIDRDDCCICEKSFILSYLRYKIHTVKRMIEYKNEHPEKSKTRTFCELRNEIKSLNSTLNEINKTKRTLLYKRKVDDMIMVDSDGKMIPNIKSNKDNVKKSSNDINIKVNEIFKNIKNGEYYIITEIDVLNVTDNKDERGVLYRRYKSKDTTTFFRTYSDFSEKFKKSSCLEYKKSKTIKGDKQVEIFKDIFNEYGFQLYKITENHQRWILPLYRKQNISIVIIYETDELRIYHPLCDINYNINRSSRYISYKLSQLKESDVKDALSSIYIPGRIYNYLDGHKNNIGIGICTIYSGNMVLSKFEFSNNFDSRYLPIRNKSIIKDLTDDIKKLGGI